MVYCVIFLCLIFLVSGDESIVNTQYGNIQGVVGDQYRAFYGIPFVSAPVGDLRWTFPLPGPKSWSPNTLQATSFKPGCPQVCVLPPHTCPYTTSEDCLFLNIFTPRIASLSKPQPVMVFLPGGHFEQGGATCELYQPYWMVEKGNVLVVTVAYRLGFLGWLSTSFLDGNFGFSDQIQALKWVQQNIANFGGDPNQVTLFGQSAGATSIRGHLISPASNGLFHRVIMQSDPFSLPMRDLADAITFGNEFLNQVQCKDIVCLRNLTIDKLLTSQSIVEKELNLGKPIENFLPFTPTVDGSLIPSHFIDALKKGAFKSIPMLIGDVSEDAFFFVYKGFNFSVSTFDYEIIVSYIFVNDTLTIQQLYPPLPIIGDKRPQLSILGTDYIFECPARYVYELMVKNNTNLYLYQFDHPLPGPLWGPAYPFCANRVCHGAELPFIFYSDSLGQQINFSQDEINLASNMIGYWVNFAQTANPNNGPYKVPVPWSFWNPTGLMSIHFATPTIDLQSGLRNTYCDVLDTIGYKHGW